MNSHALKQYIELFHVAGADDFIPSGYTITDNDVEGIASIYAYEPPTPGILSVINGEISQCSKCTNIAKYMMNVVCGIGDVGAPVFIIGNPPTPDESGRGLPFVGTAFMKLNNNPDKKPVNRFGKILQAINLTINDCFITNITKCRPETFDQAQMSQCLYFLNKQIEAVKPKVILIFGCAAANILYDKREKISYYRQNPDLTFMDIPVYVTHNPSEFNRDEGLAALAWEDLKLFMNNFGDIE